MPKDEVVIGLDIGSSKIRTLVARVISEEDIKPHIIGVGEVPANGVRRGVIVDVEEATSSISNSLEKAERTSGVSISHAYVSVGGAHVISETSKGVIAVARADNEITEDDISRVIDAASAISIPMNHEILHVIPKDFIVDGQEGVKDPVGMNGVRLEVEAVILEGSSSYIKNLTKCVSRAGLEIDDLIVSPLAVSQAVLTKRQKELGVVAVDIGGGTTGLVVFEEGEIIHAAVLPIGAEYITNDLAIGLRTSIETAEKVKLQYGCARAADVDRKEEIDLSSIDENEEGKVSKKHIAEIIEARLGEIFSMVDKELKKVDRSGKLPAGVVLTGGGAKLPRIADLAKDELKLPSKIGHPQDLTGVVENLDDPAYATAVGLIQWGIKHLSEKGFKATTSFSISDTAGRIKKWLKNFLP